LHPFVKRFLSFHHRASALPAFGERIRAAGSMISVTDRPSDIAKAFIA
jgi:hypothetical protein